MPFKSSIQEKFMYSQHPDIAKKWTEEYGQQKNLPRKVKPEHVKMPKSPWTDMSNNNMSDYMKSEEK